MGQEAQLTELYPDHGHGLLRKHTGRREHAAISTENYNEIRLGTTVAPARPCEGLTEGPYVLLNLNRKAVSLQPSVHVAQLREHLTLLGVG